MAVSKDLEDLLRQAQQQGFEVEDGGKHRVVRYDGTFVTSVPYTPSEYRGLANVRSQLRRAGMVDSVPRKEQTAQRREEKKMNELLQSLRTFPKDGEPEAEAAPEAETEATEPEPGPQLEPGLPSGNTGLVWLALQDSDRPLTGRQAAEAVGCDATSIYHYVRRLRQNGFDVVERAITGPLGQLRVFAASADVLNREPDLVYMRAFAEQRDANLAERRTKRKTEPAKTKPEPEPAASVPEVRAPEAPPPSDALQPLGYRTRHGAIYRDGQGELYVAQLLDDLLR